MPHRSKKISSNRKTISQTDRSIQLNMNACDQTQNNITSRLESIGNLIIDELKGTERDHLKQQLLTYCISNTTTNNNLPFSSLRRSLKQVLADLHTFDCHNQRQFHTIGIGDNDVNGNTSTVNINKLDITTKQPIKNTNMLNDESQLLTTAKRKTRRTSFANASQIIENETKKTPNPIIRTICTRSSKLNTLNNNQDQFNHILPNRARKRRSSLIDNINNTTEKPHLDLHKTTGEDVSGIKVSRKKLQLSVPSSTIIECLKTTNDF